MVRVAELAGTGEEEARGESQRGQCVTQRGVTVYRESSRELTLHLGWFPQICMLEGPSGYCAEDAWRPG